MMTCADSSGNLNLTVQVGKRTIVVPGDTRQDSGTEALMARFMVRRARMLY
jgi:hypothetical protein